MKHSPTTVSDILNDLIEVDEEIDNLLLVGQQVSLIETAGELYNHLRSLVTDPYLTEAEYKWVCSIGKKWNTTVEEYRKQHPELRDGNTAIDDLLDHLFDGGGFEDDLDGDGVEGWKDS